MLDVARLKIHTCEGNISGKRGNHCGTLEAKLHDPGKNPTGHHRCWASINNKDDQLYKVSRELFRSQAVVFFVSVRWGQANSLYQRLFERLSWIENREAPEYLRPQYAKYWSSIHTVEWWKQHWQKTGLVDVRCAQFLPESDRLLCNYWTERPSELNEDPFMRAMPNDVTRLIGLFCLVARKR